MPKGFPGKRTRVLNEAKDLLERDKWDKRTIGQDIEEALKTARQRVSNLEALRAQTQAIGLMELPAKIVHSLANTGSPF